MTKTLLGENRCANTADILAMYNTARAFNLERNLEPATATALDPEGAHVLTLIMENHQAIMERETPAHHRTSTVLKIRDSGKVLAVFLDVTDEQWRQLLTIEEADALPNEHVAPGRPRKLPSRLSVTVGT